MSKRATKQEIRDRNIEAILDAAERAFALSGYEGASISRIAEMAGMPKSNVTYYFSSKAELYRQVLHGIFRIWLDAAADFDRADDPEQALTAYIHQKMDLARERAFGSKVWANEIIHGAPFIQDYLETTLVDWLHSREAILRRWMDAGKIRQMDPRTIFFMIWATTQHYADFGHQIATLNGNRPLDDRQWQAAKEDVTGIILQGLGIRT